MLFRSISNDKEAYVVDLMQFPNGVLFWDLEFLREIHHDGESNSLFVFWDVICGVLLSGIGDDKMCWTPAKSKSFEVSSHYQALLGVCTRSFPWRNIWKQKVPSRVAFFVWTVALGTILTIDNLHKKVLILDWCCMCKSNGESVDHFLLHCPIVYELWSMVFNLFGIYWAMPKIVVELLACWQGNFGHHRNGVIWMAVPHCLM